MLFCSFENNGAVLWTFGHNFRKGGNPDILNYDGQSPLHLAVNLVDPQVSGHQSSLKNQIKFFCILTLLD